MVVRLLICQGDERLWYTGAAEERDHLELGHPLGDRVVIDYETGEAMPLYVPTWWNNRQTKAPGFYTDPAEALDAWELLPEGVEREVPRVNVSWGIRTLGF